MTIFLPNVQGREYTVWGHLYLNGVKVRGYSVNNAGPAQTKERPRRRRNEDVDRVEITASLCIRKVQATHRSMIISSFDCSACTICAWEGFSENTPILS